MFSLKEIIPEGSKLRPLTNSQTGAKGLVMELMRDTPQDQLMSLLDEVKRYRSKVGSISDHLLLRNSEGIIEQARVVKDALKQAESSEVHFDLANSKIDFLEEQFLKPYEGVESSLKKLEQGYSTHSLAVNYMRFLKAKTHLIDLVSSTIDIDQASEAYLQCYHMMQQTSFEGLKHFENFREQIESAKILISAECGAKLVKSLDQLCFSETKQIMIALSKLHLMQVKIQEIANKAMRDNFSLIKEIFTDTLKLSESNLKESLDSFHPRICKVIDEIVVNSQKIWVLEVAFFEKKSTLKEKDLITLFMLYFNKLVHMLIQTFQKLIENKSKLPINYQMIYLSSGIFIKELSSMTHKLFTFIAAHPNGSDTNHITLETLEAVVNKDLPVLLSGQFQSIITARMNKFIIFRNKMLASTFSPDSVTLDDSWHIEIDNQLSFMHSLVKFTVDDRQFIYDQITNWMNAMFDSIMAHVNGDDLEDLYVPMSINASLVCRCYKVTCILVRIKYHLSDLISTFTGIDMPPGLLDLINSHGAILASIGKKLCQSIRQADAMQQTDVIEEICVHDSFYVCLLAIMDCRSWSNTETVVFCFMYRSRLLIDQEVEYFTRGETQIDADIKTDLRGMLAEYEPNDQAETLICSQLKLYCL